MVVVVLVTLAAEPSSLDKMAVLVVAVVVTLATPLLVQPRSLAAPVAALVTPEQLALLYMAVVAVPERRRHPRMVELACNMPSAA